MQTECINEDFTGEFQQAQEEVLTYVLSEQIPCSPRAKNSKKVARVNERHKLELIGRDRNPEQEFDFKQINRNIRKSQQSSGRIIKVGNATFRSNFECGNLQSVALTGFNTYEIELTKQSNSNRTSAWFYFSVEGVKGEAHFIIKGFTKSSSLYNQGMKVCYRETKEITKWRRGGTRISYTHSEDQQTDKHSYELRFSHFFKSNVISCIEFAYCFPYGLKKLSNLLGMAKGVGEVGVLGKSFNGVKIPMLTIGNQNSENVIVLSARVHPGQSVSSFIIEGFIKELLGDNQFGKTLRNHFLFKIIPMLNPDGVLNGNYRFSGYGCDLNRKWKSTKEAYHPQIYHIKDLIRTANRQKKVIMYMDIHGHSRKKNVFFYGCSSKGSENPRPKTFPLLMEKIYDAFRYENCCFSVQASKEGTARITMWKQLKIDYVYTLEASFCSSQYGPNYLEADYQKLGKKLCQGITALFYDQIKSQIKTQIGSGLKHLQKLVMLKQKVLEELMENPRLMEVGNNEDSGSDSEPETGQVLEKERNSQTGLPRPEALIKDKEEHSNRSRRIKISTKIVSQQSINQTQNGKIKSEAYGEELRIKMERPESREKKNKKIVIIESDKPNIDKVEIKIANSVNTFQLETLRASSLYQRNLRVHSITRNNHELTDRNTKILNPFTVTSTPQTDKEGRIKINLIQGREGAQYRRVRKIAEENMKKQIMAEDSGKIVKELHGNQIEMEGNNIGPPPRFYPLSQQRNRRASLEAYIKRQARPDEFKRLSINGDQLNVRCVGKHVFL